MKSIAANAEMKNLATKVRVTKLRDREGGSKMVRSATPMSKLRAPLERPKERLRQAVTRHQTAANLPPLDSLIIAGNSIFQNNTTLLIGEDEGKPTNIIFSSGKRSWEV